MAFVEWPEHDAILDIRRNCKLLEGGVKGTVRTISRQVGNNNDDHLVVRVVAASRVSVQAQPLVAVHQLDKVRHVPVGDLLWSEPECPTFHGAKHKGTDGSGPAEILVGLHHVSLDPVCDGTERI
jgi:hypothetical protein